MACAFALSAGARPDGAAPHAQRYATQKTLKIDRTCPVFAPEALSERCEQRATDLGGVANDREARVLHVLRRHSLHIRRSNSLNGVREASEILPAAAQQFEQSQLLCLPHVALLRHPEPGEESIDLLG